MNSTVLINGAKVTFDAYSINDYTYFKLRDIALALSGSDKQFDVSWDETSNALNLFIYQPYTAVGGEFSASGNLDTKSASLTTSKVYLDGNEVLVTAYTINGNNYFKLRDLSKSIKFGISWDIAINTISIDTTTDYIPQ